MERAIQIYAIINFVVIGLSHALRPRVWVEFFAFLKERGEAGVFAAAFLSLIFGSIIVAFHNVWTGIPVILTVLGWAQVAKALLYFTFPAFGFRKLQIPSPERAHLFVYPGLVFLLLAALLSYHVWFA
jgi:hypothetical protein